MRPLLAVLLLAGCLPITDREPGAPPHQRCAFAAQELRETNGPVDLGDCRGLLRLHLDGLVAGDRVARAVQLYRALRRSGDADQDDLRHLLRAVLRRGVHHRDPAVRVAAIQLIRLHDVPLTGDVAARLGDRDQLVRTWAAALLFQTRRGKQVLLGQLSSRQARARVVALREVGRLYRGMLALLTRGARDPAARVRAAASVGLASTREPEAVATLLELVRDKDPGVRARAVAGLGLLGQQRGRAAVRTALKDDAVTVRKEAVVALDRLGGAGTVELLGEQARGQDLAVALAAGLALARRGQPQPALDAVARALAHKDRSMWIQGLEAAAAIEDSGVVELARKGLADSDPRVQLAAARALLAHGERRTVQTTVEALWEAQCEAAGSGLCVEIASLLARVDSRQALPLLRNLARRAAAPASRILALRAALEAGADPDLTLDALADADPVVSVEAAGLRYSLLEKRVR